MAIRRPPAYAALPLLLAAACTPASPAAPPNAPVATTTARAQPPGPIHHVLLITLDGLLPDAYVHPDAHGLRIPTLRSIVARGASSEGALSVFPTVTYPSHTSMVTGVVPGKHGITSNRSFDPLEDDQEGWRWYAEDIKRDPVWRLAERAGYATATVHWPVTVGAEVTWRVPEYWRAKNDNDRKLVRALSTPGLFDGVVRAHPDFWSRFAPPNVHDDALTDIATYLLAEKKPTLLLLHLVEVDGEQHKHGVWSEEAKAAIENDDRQLARIFATLESAGLSGDTDVIIASDHGFMNASKMVKPGVLLREAGLVTREPGGRIVDWKATAVVNSGESYVYVRDGADEATKATVRRIFTERAKDPQSGIGRVYESQEIVALGGDPTAFLALEAAPGYQLGGGTGGDYVAPGMYQATHGYDPNRPEMHSSLLMIGPGIAHGAIVDAHVIDIGPTIAHWLGLPLENVDGHVLQVR